MREAISEGLTPRKGTIAIVGAGIIGLAIAYRLIAEYDDVLLIDPQRPGSEASSGNAGHIATEQIFPLASPATIRRVPKLLFGRNAPVHIRGRYAMRILPWLLRFVLASRPKSFQHGTHALASLQFRAIESLQRLCADAGLEKQLHSRGHLIVAESKSSADELAIARTVFDRYGIESSWVSSEDVQQRAPGLRRGLARALLLKGTGHVVNPHRLCESLHSAYATAGGKTLRSRVHQVESPSRGRFILHGSAGSIEAGKVIIAAGAWSEPLVRQLGHPVPLDTERGYNVTASKGHGVCDISIASLDRNTIMTPLDCGIRITGFVEFGGLKLPPNPARTSELEVHLKELLPHADLGDVTQWMGFRPSLPDHLPVIGASPKDPNVLFAFGHQHLGLTLGGITAELIAALVSGRRCPVDVRPFRIDRFGSASMFA